MKLNNVNKKFNENNKQFAYRTLKENIMKLTLKPGEIMSEKEISSLLNISRTPVREAIVKLKEKKLVTVFPQKGSIVSKMNLNLIEEGAFLREICEKEILRIACQSHDKTDLIKSLKKNIGHQKLVVEYDESTDSFFDLDNEFHEIIFNYFNKTNIWKSVKQIGTHYDRIRFFDTFENRNFNKLIKQHEKIVEVIENGKTEEIDILVEEHLFNFKEKKNELTKKFSEYFED